MNQLHSYLTNAMSREFLASFAAHQKCLNEKLV